MAVAPGILNRLGYRAAAESLNQLELVRRGITRRGYAEQAGTAGAGGGQARVDRRAVRGGEGLTREDLFRQDYAAEKVITGGGKSDSQADEDGN